MVRFKPGAIEIPKGVRAAAVEAVTVNKPSLKRLNAKHGVVKVKQLYKDVLEIRPDWTHLENQYVLIFPKDRKVKEVADEYKKDSNVISATPVGIVHAFETDPNDPYFSDGKQYGLTNISAPQAWDRTTGSASITVAVLDTGINYNHEDFTAGRIDLANAKDYVNDDNDPLDDHSSAHGTSVSGVIAAATNNSTGIAGVDWNATILPIKVLDSNGKGSIPNILQGLAWASAQNVDVINMSFGQDSTDSTLQQACSDAYDNGAVLVAAAGNGDVETPSYPAAYSTVLAVGAVDSDDVRSVWSATEASNYGSWVDVCAAGTAIWSVSTGTDHYAASSGTSLASPFVAGLAALVKSVNPGMTNQEIMDKIKDSADNIDSLNPGYENKLGSGRVNAYRAVAGAIGSITTPESGDYLGGTINVYGSAGGWDFSNYVLEAEKNGLFVTTIESSSVSVESALLGRWDTAGLNGEYTIKLRVFAVTLGSTESEIDICVDNTTPEATITFPSSGATVEGEITVLGSALDQYLDNFTLEYGQGTDPSSFQWIKTGSLSVESDILGTWETSGLNGTYILRLIVTDKIGAIASQEALVNIKSSSPNESATSMVSFAGPNPATSEVTFQYDLLGNFATRIYVFDITGKLIWRQSYTAGENGAKSGKNTPTWNLRSEFGSNNIVSNGVYIYLIVANNKAVAKGKFIVLN